MPTDHEDRISEISESTITKNTRIPLEMTIAICGAIVMILLQWFDMRMKIADLDAKQTAAIVAVDGRVTAARAASSGDHRLLCAIAAKLQVIGGDCP